MLLLMLYNRFLAFSGENPISSSKSSSSENSRSGSSISVGTGVTGTGGGGAGVFVNLLRCMVGDQIAQKYNESFNLVVAIQAVAMMILLFTRLWREYCLFVNASEKFKPTFRRPSVFEKINENIAFELLSSLLDFCSVDRRHELSSALLQL